MYPYLKLSLISKVATLFKSDCCLSKIKPLYLEMFKESFLKYPSILNEILPFVTIISIAFLMRNLINNNEFMLSTYLFETPVRMDYKFIFEGKILKIESVANNYLGKSNQPNFLKSVSND